MAKKRNKKQKSRKPKKQKVVSEVEQAPVKNKSRRRFIASTALMGGGYGAWYFLNKSSKKPPPKKHLTKKEAKAYFDKKIQGYTPTLQKFFSGFIDPQLAYQLDTWDSLFHGAVTATKIIDNTFVEKYLDDYLHSCEKFIFTFDSQGKRSAKNTITWQGGKTFEQCSIMEQLTIISTVLFLDKKVDYEHNTKISEAYTLSYLLKNNKGNCTTMPTLFALLAERCGLPVSLSYVGKHVFARYDSLLGSSSSKAFVSTAKSNSYLYSKHTQPRSVVPQSKLLRPVPIRSFTKTEKEQGYINIECTNKNGSGLGMSDLFYYAREADISPVPNNLVEHGSYLRTLSKKEAIGGIFANHAFYLSQNRGGDKTKPLKMLAYALYLNNRDYQVIQNINQEIQHIATHETKSHYEQLYRDLIQHINVMFRGNFRVQEKKKRSSYTSAIDTDPAHYAKQQQRILDKKLLEQQKRLQKEREKR